MQVQTYTAGYKVWNCILIPMIITSYCFGRITVRGNCHCYFHKAKSFQTSCEIKKCKIRFTGPNIESAARGNNYGLNRVPLLDIMNYITVIISYAHCFDSLAQIYKYFIFHKMSSQINNMIRKILCTVVAKYTEWSSAEIEKLDNNIYIRV